MPLQWQFANRTKSRPAPSKYPLIIVTRFPACTSCESGNHAQTCAVSSLLVGFFDVRTGSLNALVRNAGLECSCGAGIDAESVQAKGFPCALVIMSSTFCPRRKSDDAVGITAALTLTMWALWIKSSKCTSPTMVIGDAEAVTRWMPTKEDGGNTVR